MKNISIILFVLLSQFLVAQTEDEISSKLTGKWIFSYGNSGQYNFTRVSAYRVYEKNHVIEISANKTFIYFPPKPIRKCGNDRRPNSYKSKFSINEQKMTFSSEMKAFIFRDNLYIDIIDNKKFVLSKTKSI